MPTTETISYKNKGTQYLRLGTKYKEFRSLNAIKTFKQSVDCLVTLQTKNFKAQMRAYFATMLENTEPGTKGVIAFQVCRLWHKGVSNMCIN